MKFASKTILCFGLLTAAAISSADISFSNVTATVTFDGTDVYNLDVDTSDWSIDFSALDYPIVVSSSPGDYSSAVVNISYDATSDAAVSGLELIFMGWTVGNGSIDYREVVFDEFDSEIASVSGSVSGTNVPVIITDFLSLGGGYTNYSVEKTFTLDLGFIDLGNGGNAGNLASIGLIEQNAVPEPATLGALAVGALGMLARRKRKK